MGGAPCSTLTDSHTNDLVWTQDTVKTLLTKYKIDVSLYGQGAAKSLAKLAEDIKSGACRFMLDTTCRGKLVRVVDVVLLRVRYSNSGAKDKKGSGKILVQRKEKTSDGQEFESLGLPGTKLRPSEDKKEAVWRIMNTIIRMQDCDVEFNHGEGEIVQETEESKSYPGLQTIYRKHIVEGLVREGKGDILRKFGLPQGEDFTSVGDKQETRFWSWWTDEHCKQVGLAVEGQMEKATFQGFANVPIPLTEEMLQSLFTKYGVDVHNFGRNNAKTLLDIARELTYGEVSLIEAKGKILRCADVVLLRLTDSSGKEGPCKTLIEAKNYWKDVEGAVKRTRDSKRLPGLKRRAGENVFDAVERLLISTLRLDVHAIRIGDEKPVLIEEESVSPYYPGMTTRYRKYIVSASLRKKGEVDERKVQVGGDSGARV